REHASAIFRGKPIREIENHAGKEARLRHTEQKAQREKTNRAHDKGHYGGCHPPGDHDAGNPDTRARLFPNGVASPPQKGITEAEKPCAPAINVGGKSEILVHAQRGKADVRAIHVGYEIDNHDQGEEAPRLLRDGALFESAFHGFTPWLLS